MGHHNWRRLKAEETRQPSKSSPEVLEITYSTRNQKFVSNTPLLAVAQQHMMDLGINL